WTADPEPTVAGTMTPVVDGVRSRPVDADEGAFASGGRRFHRAAQKARSRGHDSLYPRAQPDLDRALDRDDAVINLAREQAQRKAHHAARMGGQALDRQMGFAGVGGAKDGLDRMGRGRWHILVA